MLLLLGLCACDENAADIDVSELQAEEGHFSDKIDLDQAVRFLASLDMPKAEAPESSLIAPAQGSGGGSFGYINLQGEWVIKSRYSDASFFAENRTMVLENYEDYLLLDEKGNVVLSGYNGKTMDQVRHFTDGAAPASFDTGSDQKYLYIDIDGNVLIKASKLPKVSGRKYKNTEFFGFASAFTDGKAVVMRMLNADISDKYAAESAFVIDRSGQVLAKLPAGLDPEETGMDRCGNIIVKNTENLYGLCSAEGEVRIAPQYRRLLHCDGALYLACGEDGFFGYVDADGNTVIDFTYIKALPFSEGYAAVYDGQHWGFINELGECAIEFVFDDVAALKPSAADSSIGKGAFSEGLAAVCKDGYWVLINSSELPVMCLGPDKVPADGSCPYKTIRNGYITYCVRKGTDLLFGVADIQGREILAPSFGRIGIFN